MDDRGNKLRVSIERSKFNDLVIKHFIFINEIILINNLTKYMKVSNPQKYMLSYASIVFGLNIVKEFGIKDKRLYYLATLLIIMIKL